MNRWRNTILSMVTLFGSVSTLFCCALPALLVSLGAGAAVIGLVSTFPQLLWLSQHKSGLFVLAGGLLAFSAIARHGARNLPCPADPQAARSCMRLRRISTVIFYSSVLLYAVGFFFAFVARYFI